MPILNMIPASGRVRIRSTGSDGGEVTEDLEMIGWAVLDGDYGGGTIQPVAFSESECQACLVSDYVKSWLDPEYDLRVEAHLILRHSDGTASKPIRVWVCETERYRQLRKAKHVAQEAGR